MTLPPASTYRTRAVLWLRTHVLFAWLDDLNADYRDWKPEPPVYERLIR
ncbi:hypothetical protein [Synoicihabitans lomoniglobus]|uniref:Uncharacterized protein n=1 Tax=Synoicihabitans lomoniglobus TaxID=2909285 RepID=A0AAF0CM45_9BACT|nr:hypothetical protein [Opitutaceae bacterium LMO-M01]WED63603.1 hypothetical protein PXH66_14800 [Opitutaceae bacterium LMO-M01]